MKRIAAWLAVALLALVAIGTVEIEPTAPGPRSGSQAASSSPSRCVYSTRSALRQSGR